MIAALKKFFRKEEVDNIRNIIINHGVIIPEEIETGKEGGGGGYGTSKKIACGNSKG